MTPPSLRHLLSAAFLVLSVTVYAGLAWGLLIAAIVTLVLPPAANPRERGQAVRVRTAVEAAWRRLRGRRQAVAATAALVAIVVAGLGAGVQFGAGWGMLVAAVMVVGLSLRADMAE